ncbi:uncharacterized protein LOC115623092 [Scaptodrosophila lebanonensis]|uniref:Uncharacterized protein LOC115623092 n=1 Tax=Drosophila lebanonensis TaxID=7225 RepID=A0A6J2TAU7_DROLE|nr:uncharacterized protein LOC115623092 [Scaptodrosophila lebanonensis]
MNARDRVFWTEFLLLYRSLPAVWKVKSPEYSSRALKTSSYEKLVRKLREVEPDADRALVVKKINSFRTNFRRDLRKRNACADDEHFESTLWYFELLGFLEGQEEEVETSHKSGKQLRSGQQEHSDSQEEESVLFCPGYEWKKMKPSTTLKQECLSAASRTPIRSLSPSKSHSSVNTIKVKREPHLDYKARLEHQPRVRRQSSLNDSEALAHTWTAQFNELSMPQKVLARKLISDILYYGCMEQLDHSHVTQLQNMMMRNTSSPEIENGSPSPCASKVHYVEEYDEAVDAD